MKHSCKTCFWYIKMRVNEANGKGICYKTNQDVDSHSTCPAWKEKLIKREDNAE